MGSERSHRNRGARLTALAVAGVLLSSLVITPASAASTGQPVGSESVIPATHVSPRFATGDVFIGVGNGQIQWRHPDGTLNATLDTGLGGGQGESPRIERAAGDRGDGRVAIEVEAHGAPPGGFTTW